MNKRLILFLMIIGFFVFGYAYSGYFVKVERITVSKVKDGDTILVNGKEVRLLGIDAPEEGYYFYEESKNKLKQLVEGKEVILEKDVSNEDKWGRLLRYVFVEDKFANLEMVKQGYANVCILSPDVKYSNELTQAENEAREKGLGLWRSSIYSDCIYIINFHYDAKGNDNENLNDEYVVFKNDCDFVNTTGWTVKDATTNIYTFPESSLASEATVTLYSGSGKSTKTELYWNSKRAIWNNDGDRLYLRDAEGNLVLFSSY